MMITRDDLQAIVDATLEHFFPHESSRPQITVRLRDIHGGRFSRKTGRFSVPAWAANRGEAYLIYYTLHELAHLWANSHNGIFRERENALLALWGVRIERKRVYAKRAWFTEEN